MSWFAWVMTFFVLFLVPAVNAAVLNPDVASSLKSRRPDEKISVIVTLADQAVIGQFSEMPRRLRRAAIIKSLKEKAEHSQMPLRTFLQNRGIKKSIQLWLINGMALTAGADVIRELANDPRVDEIRMDAVIPLAHVTYTATTVAEWNIDRIHARDLWDLGFKGQKITVATMDSGVDGNHPDLAGRWRGGSNSWFDPYGRYAQPHDSDGHGTLVTGILVGGNGGGTAIGVAPKANWIAVKIFDDDGNARASAIHQGFQWLLDPDGNPDTDDAPDVLNNSWGFSKAEDLCIKEYESDIHALKASGIAVVFSAGNDGPQPATSSAPANNAGILSVGAIDRSNHLSDFSSRGPSSCDGSIYPRVVAPGSAITSSDLSLGGIPGSYAVVSGTSFSAPHVAGAMALLLSAFPGLPVQTLEQALTFSSTDLGSSGPDNKYGYGLIHALNAYYFVKSKTVTTTLYSQADRDGWVRESSEGSLRGGAIRKNGSLRVGDDAANRQLKSILSFDTSDIPENAVVTSAKLILTRMKASKTDPFETFRTCFVDVASGTFGSAGLEKSDFQAEAAVRRAARLTRPKKNGFRSKGLFNEEGLRAINKGGLIQLRVHFLPATDKGSAHDFIQFHGDDASSAEAPRLKVTYVVP